MNKICGHCKLEKPLTDFGSDKRTPTGKKSWCRECHRERSRLFRTDNPEAEFHHSLWSLHRLSANLYWKMFEDQGGVCKSCSKVETEQYKGVVKRLSVDHDHRCCPGRKSCGECTRGLLCAQCNRIIGMARDSQSALAACSSYLLSNQSPV